MVASSRSSRGRVSLRSEQHDAEEQQSSGVDGARAIVHHSYQHTNTQPGTPTSNPDDSQSSRVKRSRIASVSEHESLQKRRRTSKGTGPALAIPLRGRPGASAAATTPANIPRTSPGGNTAKRPQVTTHDSQTSLSSAQSPLNSPYYKPQYDQFKRIEEKAQKIVKKNLNNATPHDDKRKLRSEHGSTRSKTELAQYFPNFDDMLSLELADPNDLTAKTPVVLIDDTPTFEPTPPQLDYFRSQQAPYKSQVINLAQYATISMSEEDPLADHIYLKAHQKAERHEKQMKNGDKERAQHEKYQLERLLEELYGPDWLKTLGISGITDTEKKRYEVKRTLFIKETKALIDKFRRWKEEEKKRKLEKQQQLLDEMNTDEDADQDRASSSTNTHKKRPKSNGAASRNRSRANSRPASISASVDHLPDSHDIDALASQQLLDEAKLARKKLLSTNTHQQLISSFFAPMEIDNKPFTSFFEKRHIREAAMSGRLRGRKVYAFGQEVPEFEEEDFELPEYILTEDAIRANQRNRRRRMRATDD